MSNVCKPKSKDSRIAIVGAGAAGLATAYYLKRNGYRDVTVLEKLPRVGGLCRTITEDYKSFDLGANYITLAYRELRKMAREVGARMYQGHPYSATTVPHDKNAPLVYRSILDEIREDPARPGEKIPLGRLAWKVLRFIGLRWRLRRLIDRPTFEGLAAHDAAASDPASKLCVPFDDWLESNDLTELRKFFEIPITMMGFGYLRETPAPYVLKFMTLATFVPMVLPGGRIFGRVPGLRHLWGWPRRFVHGYERLWQRLAEDLNVLLDIDITRIGREQDEDGCNRIRINFQHPGQVLYELEQDYESSLSFDHLILACPLESRYLKRFMRLQDYEEELLGRIKKSSYCMTTLHVAEDLPKPVACVFPFDLTTMGKPWAAVQMFPGESKVVQFYTQVLAEEVGRPDVRDEVIENVVKFVYRMGNSVAGWSPPGTIAPHPVEPDAERLVTYDRWAYFQHVSDQDFRDGFYDRLEEIQGQQRTYYVGGATNFELIEPILGYAKALVSREFPA